MRKAARVVAPATLFVGVVGVSACASLSGLTTFGLGGESGDAGERPDVAIQGDASTSDVSGDDSAFADALACPDGLVDCGGVCVLASSPRCSFDAASGADGAGSADDASAEAGGDAGGGDGSQCTSLSLPPAVNVDPATWAASFKTSPVWSCAASGTTTIDSSAGSITSTSCALGTPDFTNGVAQSASGGPAVMVVRLRGLTVSAGHLIHIQGDKPVVFLVSGNVLVDSGGKIDAGASGGTAGPGGSVAANCSGSTGTASQALSTGGGGGAFGTAGGYGATGNGNNGSAGGAASSSGTLQPLRGGCSGGAGANGSGSTPGAGGGAFEISASGTITLGTGSNTAVLTAAGGGSTGATGVNAGSAGAGSGGGILLVSAGGTTVGSSGALRAHGGGSGSGRGVNANGQSGANGHSADDTPASGGAAPDVNGAAGAAGGVCSGSGCATAFGSGAHGVMSLAAGLDGSGGGGGGGRVQIITGAATSVCE